MRGGVRTRLLWAAVVAAAGCTKGEAREVEPRVETVSRRDIVVSASAAGVIEPVSTVEVKSQASGAITEISVNEGDQVTRGDLLVRVDPRLPKTAVEQARADSVVARASLDNATASRKRAEMLYAAKALTEVDLEAAKLAEAQASAALIRAQSNLEDAKIAFEQTEVRAPSSGTVLSRSVELGTVIAAASRDVGGGAVLMTMANLDTVQVRALVDETDIGEVRAGLPVTLTVAAFPNRRFEGVVLRVGAQAVQQQNVTMFPVLIRIRNQDGLLKPGMNAEVAVHVKDVRDAVAVPNAALRTASDLSSAAGALGVPVDSLGLPADEAARIQVLRGNDGRSGGGRGGGRSGEGGGFRGGFGGGPGAFGAGQGAGANASGSRAGQRRRPGQDATFGGSYVVLTRRQGAIRAVPVRTGATDYEYSVVISGLSPGDTVLVLPTAGLLDEQAQRQEFIQRRVGNPLGGGR